MKPHNIFIFLVISVLIGCHASDKLIITLWEEEDKEIQDTIDKFIKQYTSKHEGIVIRRSHYSVDDLRNLFQSAAISGAGADMAIAPNDFAGVWSRSMIIMPVDNIIEKSKYHRIALEAVSLRGHIWGIPISLGNHLMLLYNKKYVNNPPSTLQELIETCRTLEDKYKPKDKDFKPLVFNYSDPYFFIIFYLAFSPDIIDRYGRPNIDVNALERAFKLYQNLKFVYKILPEGINYDTAHNLFVAGHAAFMINGDWAYGDYITKLKGNLGVAPFPKIQDAGRLTPLIGGKFLFINVNVGFDPKRKKEVLRFAKYITSKIFQKVLAEKFRRLPTLLELYTEVVPKDKYLMASASYLKYGQIMPPAVAMRAIWDPLGSILNKLLNKSIRLNPGKAARKAIDLIRIRYKQITR